MNDEKKINNPPDSAEKKNEILLAQIFRSREEWQATIDAMTDYMFVVGIDRTIKKANMSFSKRFGKHPREIIGTRTDTLFLAGEACLENILAGVTIGAGPMLEEIEMDDSIYLLNAFPTVYEDGPVVVYIMKDVTEITRLKKQMYHSYKLLSLGQLVSGVAHELNNPLTGILGFAELLLRRTKDSDNKKDLEKIQTAAERCKVIVESLLRFSRQQPGEKIHDYINDIIDKTLTLRAYVHRLKEIEVVKEYGDLPLAYVDTQQFQQAIFNIILNAEQAVSGAGKPGRIAISTAYDSDKRNIVITIADNGDGIPTGHIDRIFDPFFTTRPVDQGTGLGLSIAYGVVKEHGGDIQVESARGEGTTFTISLPVNRPDGVAHV